MYGFTSDLRLGNKFETDINIRNDNLGCCTVVLRVERRMDLRGIERLMLHQSKFGSFPPRKLFKNQFQRQGGDIWIQHSITDTLTLISLKTEMNLRDLTAFDWRQTFGSGASLRDF